MIRRRARAPTWSIPAWYAAAALLAALYLPRLESRLGLALDTGLDPGSLLAMFSLAVGIFSHRERRDAAIAKSFPEGLGVPRKAA